MSRPSTKDQVRCCTPEALLCLTCRLAFAYISRAELAYMAASLIWLLHAAAGTPYQDGSFRMKMVLGADFPRTPPKGMPQPCATTLITLTC